MDETAGRASASTVTAPRVERNGMYSAAREVATLIRADAVEERRRAESGIGAERHPRWKMRGSDCRLVIPSVWWCRSRIRHGKEMFGIPL